MRRLWACITRLGPHRIRRGTWYEVLDDSAPDTVVLGVGIRQVRVNRDQVEIHSRRPFAWTVVIDTERNTHFGKVYAVCPACLARARLTGAEESMPCPSCDYRFDVDWPAGYGPVRREAAISGAVATGW